jgi:hypothetical protein
MNETDQLKKELADKTAALNQKFDLLQETAREILDPAAHIEKHPLVSVGVSIGAGLLVGSQLSKSRKLLEPLAVSLFTSLMNAAIRKYTQDVVEPTHKQPLDV